MYGELIRNPFGGMIFLFTDVFLLLLYSRYLSSCFGVKSGWKFQDPKLKYVVTIHN